MEKAAAAGQLRAGINAKRMAAMTMQTVMFNAQSSPSSVDSEAHSLSADEVWDFCANGFARG
jgi:hypothetical protein